MNTDRLYERFYQRKETQAVLQEVLQFLAEMPVGRKTLRGKILISNSPPSSSQRTGGKLTPTTANVLSAT